MARITSGHPPVNCVLIWAFGLDGSTICNSYHGCAAITACETKRLEIANARACPYVETFIGSPKKSSVSQQARAC